jgi:hypothetical protein
MILEKNGKMLIASVAVLTALSLCVGAATVFAFSVDVNHLYYYDPSGPRTIDYDFSAGALGDGTTIPANSILIPSSAVLQKHAVDVDFIFGNIPLLGVAAVTLNAGVSTVATTQGVVVLQGSSSTTPPAPATSWTYWLALQNFSGITDATKAYQFQIGLAAPMGGVTQPQINGFWTASGRLFLQALIYDELNDADLWSSGQIDLGVTTTPANTNLVLKMVNNGAAVDFYYNLNGGGDVKLGTYAIASGLVFNSLPSRFPYLYMEEGAPESPFRVSSQHWVDTNGDKYHAWARVEDDHQIYSAVTVSSPGYLDPTPMTFNSARNYWSLDGTLFSDDFNDNAIDTAKWTTAGSTVAQSGGTFNVDQAAQDAGGKALSRTIVINPYAPIVVQRKAKVHYANNYFDGLLGLYFGNSADFAAGFNLNAAVMSVIASHTNYVGTTTGFYIDRWPAHLTAPTARTDAIWDTWFEEKIFYNPVSGMAELWIDGTLKASLNVGALPSTARYMTVFLESWGWYTGHSNDSDDVTVSQPWTGGTVFLSDTTPPAGTVTFNFTATKKAGGTDTVSQNITGYVTGYAKDLLPAGAVNTHPVFSWTGVTGAESYSVEVNDENGNRLWNQYDIPAMTTSVPYSGPPLESAKTYTYWIQTGIETDGQHNASFAQGRFTFTGTAVAGLKGDINGDGMVDLTDAMLCLKVLAGLDPTVIRASYPVSGADVSGDGRIGMPEIHYILQTAAGLR